MIKKLIFMLGMLTAAVTANAQLSRVCATDEYNREQIALHPEIVAEEARLNADIQRYISGRLANAKGTKATADATTPWIYDTLQMYIPVVVHIIHNYGLEYYSDNEVYAMMDRLNTYYNQKNNLSSVIDPFKPWIGNFHITFYLARKDPQGNPTRGILRQRSFLTNGGDDAAKIGLWPPDQYLNLYFESIIGRGVANGVVQAYATFPSSYVANPYSQGVISRADQIVPGSVYYSASTIAHEIGHYLNLYHPWNSNDSGVGKDCGDDEVDDTPPTRGHPSGCDLYDTACATGYGKYIDTNEYYLRTGIKLHNVPGGNVFINYPDTVNTQNIMDYSNCAMMFTKGQVGRGRAALYSNVGNRNNLWSTKNLVLTGILAADGATLTSAPDLSPIADFSVNHPFTCADGSTPTTFTNRSYNDTLSSSDWTFSNGATSSTSGSLISLQNSFSQPGWVTTTLTATGNNTGSNTVSKSRALYAADTARVSAGGYFQEFNPDGDTAKYPIFNYFGTDHKWEFVNNAGYFDHTAIRYANYDTRTRPVNIGNATASPSGDFADFYTRAFDLTEFSSTGVNMDFFAAGAFRTSKLSEMNDELQVAISTDCGSNWRVIASLVKGDLQSAGYREDNFTPTRNEEWKEHSIPVPTVLVSQPRAYFRFRFTAGSDFANYTGFAFGTGNNFYIDRIQFTNSPLGVSNGIIVNLGMSVAPNPTSGAATVSINGGDNTAADISVADVTGKLVYHKNVVRSTTVTKVEIPAEAISVKGMYLVKVVTNGATETKKLVVY